MKKKWLTLVFGSALFLAACGGGNDKDEAKSGDTAAQPDGEKIVMTSCATCHGGQLQGMGTTPGLSDVGSRYSEDEILDIILNGKSGGMPAGLIQGEQAEAAAAWLATQK